MAAARKVNKALEQQGPIALLLSRFTETAMFAEKDVDLIIGCLHGVAETAADAPEIMAAASNDNYWPAEPSSYKPYIVNNGTLEIPIKGALINNFDWQIGSYATGYNYIEEAWNRGMADPEVQRIALIVDSPGGAAAGNFELVEHMNATKTKPTETFIVGNSYSAAYSISTVGDSINASRSSGVGSIGVLMTHVDFSKALDQQGIVITFIQEGEHKTDGSPFKPLSKAAKARMQESVSETYGVFVSTVAKGRGMDEQKVRDTEAATFTATKGLEIGLIDTIGPHKQAIAAYRAGTTREGATAMAITDAEKAAHETALADLRKAGEVATATAVANAAKAERERIAGIMSCDEAKKRPALAQKLAHSAHAYSVDAAKEILSAAAEETAATGETAEQKATREANEAAMEAALGNGTGVTGGKGKDGKEGTDAAAKTPEAMSLAIMKDYASAGGAGFTLPK